MSFPQLTSEGEVESDSLVATHVTAACSVRVCMSSVTLVHSAKVVGRNEMSFDRDTLVEPSNIVLDSNPGPPREGVFDVSYRVKNIDHILVNTRWKVVQN